MKPHGSTAEAQLAPLGPEAQIRGASCWPLTGQAKRRETDEKGAFDPVPAPATPAATPANPAQPGR